MIRLAMSVHTKRHHTVEVRTFLALPTHKHRLGTWCLPEFAWGEVRAMLLQQRTIAVTLDESAWTYRSRSLPPVEDTQ